jgi:hypothetical protein
MVTEEESATVSEEGGGGVAREAGRVEKGGLGDGDVRGAQGGRGEQRRQHSRAQWRPDVPKNVFTLVILGDVSRLITLAMDQQSSHRSSRSAPPGFAPVRCLRTHARRSMTTKADWQSAGKAPPLATRYKRVTGSSSLGANQIHLGTPSPAGGMFRDPE